MDRLQAAIVRAHEVWNRRVPTARLNQWLTGMLEAHPPPAPGGRRIKIRYITQAKTRPPGFVAMCSHPEKLPAAYSRYLVNGLREDFDMPGTPIRLTISIGVGSYPEHGSERDTLLDHADKAMYRAKSLGRDTVCSAADLEGE